MSEYIDFNMRAFAKEVKRKREALGFSQYGLGLKLGLTNVTISRIEGSHGHGCSLRVGVALAYFLQIDLMKFVLDNEGREDQEKLPLDFSGF